MKHPIVFAICASGITLSAVLLVLGNPRGAFAGVPVLIVGVAYGLRGQSYREESERNTAKAKTSGLSRWRNGA